MIDFVKNIFLLLTLMIATINVVHSQEIKKLDASPLDFSVFRPGGQDAYPLARIIYSRPQKKGREIFGALVPYGQIWRTGANQSTELNLYKDITIQGKKLSAGNYTVYSIPDQKEWTIIINSKLYTWGDYDYDSSKDVMTFKVSAVKSDKIHENFGFAFNGENGKATLLMAWDQTEVYIDFEY